MTNQQEPRRRASDQQMLVDFDVAEQRVALREPRALRQWVDHWLRREPDSLMIMGCGPQMGRAGRVRRLRSLRGALTRCGVAADRIRYTGDAVAAPLSPADSAWIKVIPTDQAQGMARPIRALLSTTANDWKPACTSAS